MYLEKKHRLTNTNMSFHCHTFFLLADESNHNFFIPAVTSFPQMNPHSLTEAQNASSALTGKVAFDENLFLSEKCSSLKEMCGHIEIRMNVHLQ